MMRKILLFSVIILLLGIITGCGTGGSPGLPGDDDNDLPITGEIRGTVTWSGGANGVKVLVFAQDPTTSDTPDSIEPVKETKVPTDTGAYTISDLAEGTYYVVAYKDENEDGELNMGQEYPLEPSGFYGMDINNPEPSPSPVVIDSSDPVTGIDITLYSAVIDFDGVSSISGTISLDEGLTGPASVMLLDFDPMNDSEDPTAFEPVNEVVTNQDGSYTFDNISGGIYYIVAYIDENDDGQLNFDTTNGEPTEPAGYYSTDPTNPESGPGAVIVDSTDPVTNINFTVYEIQSGNEGNATINGTVIWEGNDISGTEVLLFTDNPLNYDDPTSIDPFYDTIVNNDGSYTITGIAPDDYYVIAYKDVNDNGTVEMDQDAFGIYEDTEGLPKVITITNDETINTITIYLEIKDNFTSSISGTVSIGEGDITGTEVVAFEENPLISDNPDMIMPVNFTVVDPQDGSYTLELPVGSFYIFAYNDEASGYYQDAISGEPLTVTVGENEDVEGKDILLQGIPTLYTFNIKAFDPTSGDLPISSQDVKVYSPTGIEEYSGITDGSGECIIENIDPASYYIEVSAPVGYLPVRTPVYPLGDGAGTLNFGIVFIKETSIDQLFTTYDETQGLVVGFGELEQEDLSGASIILDTNAGDIGYQSAPESPLDYELTNFPTVTTPVDGPEFIFGIRNIAPGSYNISLSLKPDDTLEILPESGTLLQMVQPEYEGVF